MTNNISYWEGAVSSRTEEVIGYVEMTGYAPELTAEGELKPKAIGQTFQ